MTQKCALDAEWLRRRKPGRERRIRRPLDIDPHQYPAGSAPSNRATVMAVLNNEDETNGKHTHAIPWSEP
jgi:hypothetical protein